MYLQTLLPLTLCLQLSYSITHEKTLMWTEEVTSTSARIIGIGGDPYEWIQADQLDKMGQARPTDPIAAATSNRLALAFRYSSMNIYWSDRGFRQILKSKLQEHDDTPYIYNTTLNRIYSGTSVDVNGLAVDWLSGSIYWSDAKYDWISMANVEKLDIYRHIITQDMEQPMGLVVHPKRGKLYWADAGLPVRIEVANLDGSGRKVLHEIADGQPTGLAIDYAEDVLYWVDALQGSINKYDLQMGTYAEYPVTISSLGSHIIQFFGITIYEDMLFTTDQRRSAIRVFNKTTFEHIRSFPLDGAPFDIMMYDEGQQEPLQTQCSVLQCEHICVSLGEGQAKCMCKQGYSLDSDKTTCKMDARLTPPVFVYSVGSKLCSARINIADRRNLESLSQDIDCFYTNVSHAQTLAFHADADSLYYSDSGTNSIEKLDVQKDFLKQTIAVHTGKIGGMDVDWLSSNIYWTDDKYGHIMVATMHGLHPKVLIDNLSKPRGIAVNPQTGVMYWADAANNRIWRAYMDGTNMTLFRGDMTSPDGLAIILEQNRLYWLENSGIRSAKLDGTDRKAHVDSTSNAVGDVAVYQDYLAYTDGKGNVDYATETGDEDPYIIPHVESYVSHDIITYDSVMQPIDKPGHCDVDNGGCSQLCLPIPTGRTCVCAYGYTLGDDMKTCSSKLVSKKFMLMVDPYQRQIYQINMEDPDSKPEAIETAAANFPTKVDMNPSDGHVYWLDDKDTVIKRAPLSGPSKYNGPYLYSLQDRSTIKTFIVSGFTDEIIFSDSLDNKLYRVSFAGTTRSRVLFSEASTTTALTFDNDPDTGNVYWAESYGQSVIYKQSVYETSNSKHEIWSTSLPIIALTFSKQEGKLYWASQTKIGWLDLDGNQNMVIYESTTADFSGIAETKEAIWVFQDSSKLMYKLSKSGGQMETVTTAKFLRITDMRSFDWFDGKPHSGARLSQSVGSISMGALGGIIGGTAGGLILILIIVALLFRRYGTRKLPPSDFAAQSHENPTYDTTPGMNITNVESAGTTEESPYQTLPENEKKRPDSTASRDSYLPDVVNTVGEQDTEQLVAASEITMDNNTTVAYSPQK